MICEMALIINILFEKLCITFRISVQKVVKHANYICCLYLTRLKSHYNLSPKDDKNQDRPVFCGLLSVLTVLFITPNQRVT